MPKYGFWLTLTALLYLSGCAGATVIANDCSIMFELTPTEGDIAAISDDFLRQVVAHNELWDEFCR